MVTPPLGNKMTPDTDAEDISDLDLRLPLSLKNPGFEHTMLLVHGAYLWWWCVSLPPSYQSGPLDIGQEPAISRRLIPAIYHRRRQPAELHAHETPVNTCFASP